MLRSLLSSVVLVSWSGGLAAQGYRLEPLEDLSLLNPVPPPGTDVHPGFLRFGDLDAQPTGITFGRSQPNLAGALWSKSRMPLGEWQVHLKVRLRGASKVGGEGLAFWYTKDGHAPGPVFGAPDRWTGVGVLLDTFDDDARGNNPAIMGILNDGTIAYDARQDGEGQYFGGCLRNIRNLPDNIPLHLRLTYMQGTFKVELDDAQQGKRYVNCFEKSGIKLPAGYYFGVSGATNQHPDTIELLEMTVHGAEPIHPAPDSPLASPPLVQAQPQAHVHGNMQSSSQPPSQGTLAATNVDMASLITALEAIVQKQLRTFMPKIIAGHSEESTRKMQNSLESRLTGLEELLRRTTEGVGQLQRTLASMGDHLHHLDTAHLSDDLHHLGEELKSRLESIKDAAGRMESRGEEVRRMVEPKRGYADRYGGVLLFVLAQVLVLGAFFGIKTRIDKREKKWM